MGGGAPNAVTQINEVRSKAFVGMPLAPVSGQRAAKIANVTMAANDASPEGQNNKILGAVIATGIAVHFAVLDGDVRVFDRNAEMFMPQIQENYQIASSDVIIQ